MKEECHAASAGGSAGGGGDDDGDGNATINKPSNSSATATNFDQQAKPFRPTPQSTNHPTDQPNNQVRPTSLTSSNNLTTNQPTIQPISQATNFGQQAKAFLPTSKPLYFTLLYFTHRCKRVRHSAWGGAPDCEDFQSLNHKA